MTGFATRKGGNAQARWSFEIRSVNARGLDLRFRLPEGQEALEPILRAEVAKNFSRGSVTIGLRLQSEGGAGRVDLNSEQLDAVLNALKVVETRADEQGLHLARTSGAALLGLRGVLEASDGGVNDPAKLHSDLKAEIKPLLTAFAQARAAEGKALAEILTRQLHEVADLVSQARDAAVERNAQMRDILRTNLAKLVDNADGLDEARLTQELALLAVKADVAEEIDRLEAHISAAKDLMVTQGAVGRKFDFLMQEFNREANTLCSKSGATALTQIGLDLKTVIDQMREQVQNVE